MAQNKHGYSFCYLQVGYCTKVKGCVGLETLIKSPLCLINEHFSTLRHHLTDDWAFANETEKLSRPWEYRGCEADITTTCSSFNRLLYSNEDDEWTALADRVDEEEVGTICSNKILFF